MFGRAEIQGRVGLVRLSGPSGSLGYGRRKPTQERVQEKIAVKLQAGIEACPSFKLLHDDKRR